MLFSEVPVGTTFYFTDCPSPYKRIPLFDDFPCVGAVLDIEENVSLHIFEDYEVVDFRQLSLF